MNYKYSILLLLIGSCLNILNAQTDTKQDSIVYRETYNNILVRENGEKNNKRLLSGQVSFNKGNLKKPIKNASIVIEGSKLKAKTDSTGRYSIELPANLSISSGVTVVCKVPGFKKMTRKISEKNLQNGEINFDLTNCKLDKTLK